ncbi:MULTISPECIES: NAD(P)-dependent oxidoreductase [Sphingobacterium]|jgi:3-hydroxyisobutyrate dehydrogenase|uniref:NAD(P)-dependent oxidoreductase n=1 Tax=Sphingobacterium TaxID=28453 RepID=UPI0008C6D790|nr:MULTISPECIES: NAD(P)-dependent oxidoreductase [Sphingobacterium]OFV11386.1 2-hydroxy-3-oxopropionate reductase [Sphingobacterium sp. HMSC13C05]HAU52679.1 NAD(P)-dependent oxidoreductase [Sphingobacterium sp.]
MKIEKLGFIGLGNMGHPMAKNLEKAGFPLSVYNRNRAKAAGFEKQSMIREGIAELVEHADIVFSMLSNDEAVSEVYEKILQGDIKGKLFVDMSTISRELTLSIASKLKEKGAAFIDAPVAGSTKPAAEGTLIIMVGGEQEDLHRARPYLEQMGKSIKHVGENGQGIAAKLAINYFLSTIYQGLAETILFSDKLGIQRSDMLEIINDSASGSGATKVKTPLLVEENYSPAFALDLMLKDIRLAQQAGAEYPLLKTLLDTYGKAHDQGLGQLDVIGIIESIKS